MEKLNNLSFAEERILNTVVILRDLKGSLGIQITEGSDGNVYIQSVIPGGPAHLSAKIQRGDQVVAVDGESLLGMKYHHAINLLKSKRDKVEFILARPASKSSHSFIRNKVNQLNAKESHIRNKNVGANVDLYSYNNFLSNDPLAKYSCQSPVEKYLTESCHDISNINKHYNFREVPYHKHIRYEIESVNDGIVFKKPILPKNSTLNKSLSKSCSQLYSDTNNRAVVIEMIPKNNIDMSNFHSLDRKYVQKSEIENTSSGSISSVALPRSLGLSRKWKRTCPLPRNTS